MIRTFLYTKACASTPILVQNKPLRPNKVERKIVAEIKGFGTPSPVTEFERALGQ